MSTRQAKRSELRAEISLRMWSKIAPLDFVEQRIQIKVNFLHRIGHPKGNQPPLSKSIADENYLCAEQMNFNKIKDADEWILKTNYKLSQDSVINELISKGEIDATIWIAIFEKDDLAEIKFDDAGIRQAKNLGLEILVECYSATGNGNPLIVKL